MAKWLKLFIAFCLILTAQGQERVRRTPVAGAEALWARADLRFILVGEMHGTNEAPQIFGDLVCAARDSKRTIIAGVEFQDQQALNHFMNSGTRDARVRQLLATGEWKGTDGRASTAMLALLERLRALKSEGYLSRVIAFSASRPGDSDATRNERMASILLETSTAHSDALIIVLTGNLHACKQELTGYRLMASYLPAAQTLSLVVTDRGGQAWNCQNGSCGPHALESSGGVDRGIQLVSPHAGYDGVLSTGLTATASKPASQ